MATAYPGGLRKRGGLLDYEDTIQATPRNPFLGGVADLLGQAYKLPEMPRMGVPGLDFVAANRNRLLDLLGVGDVQKTAEALSYGNRLGTGAGMTYQPLPETVGAAMAVAPFAGKAIRATEGLPVGASTNLIDDAAIFKDASVLINPKNLKPLNKVEDVEKYKTIVNSMKESGYQGRPILAYMDKGKAKALTGSHRIFAAREAGIDVPVVFVNPSVMKWEDKSGLFGTFKESINDQRVYNYLKAAGDDVAASLSKLEDQVVQPSISPYPQAEAMRLAQQRAALPVEQGGLPAEMVGAMGNQTISPIMSIPSGLTRAEQANLIQNQAENFAEKAKEMGLSALVEHSGSKAGPSSYVSISDPITGKRVELPFRFSGHSKGPFQSQFVYDVGDDFSKELDFLEKMASSIPKAERDAIQKERQAKMLEKLALAEKERVFVEGRPLVHKAMQEAKSQKIPYTKAFSNSGNYIGGLLAP